VYDSRYRDRRVEKRREVDSRSKENRRRKRERKSGLQRG
jgi:hypothetical protein